MALDLSSVSAPPAKKATTPPKKAVASRHQEYKNGVQEFFGAVSMAAVMFGLKADAGAIAIYGSAASEEIASVADEYEQVGNAVDYLNKGSVWMGLAVALLPLGMQCLANHNMLPAGMKNSAGIYDTETMESIIETQLLERKAAVMREQLESKRRVSDLKEEINSMIDEVANEGTE